MSFLSKDIIKEWGLSNLSDEKQKETADRIGRTIYQALLVRSLDILSADEQNELDTLLEVNTTTPRDVLIFLKSKIPTLEQMVLEERGNLKEDLQMSSV